MFEVLLHEPQKENLGTIILLTGRDGSTEGILSYYKKFCELDNTRLICIKPENEWYPIPYGFHDQQEAIHGMQKMVPILNSFILKIQNEFNINRSELALVGYSAGAVMAIQLGSYSNESFAAIVSHNGAILDPRDLQEAKNKTPILLIHSKDDDCFSWDERYIPMKKALLEQKYNVETIENEVGGHGITTKDIFYSAMFLANKFKYPLTWKHSSREDDYMFF